MPRDQPASGGSPRPSPWRERATWLPYVLLTVVLWSVRVFAGRWPWPWPDQIIVYLAVAGLIALMQVHRIRRGQTVAEAMDSAHLVAVQPDRQRGEDHQQPQ